MEAAPSVRWLALCWLLTAALTWLVRRYALRRKLIDAPGERRSHSVLTPRGGGLSIAAVMLLVLFKLSMDAPQWRGFLLAAMPGLVLVALVGWIDDHRSLSPGLRIVVHAMAATCLAVAALLLGADPWIAVAGALAVLALTNIWNFMDGIDGLAASQAAIAAAGYAWLAGAGVPLWFAAMLCVACLGFLPFNFPRARIFLGDVGSGSLGYLLALLLVMVLVEPRRPDVGFAGDALLLLPLAAFLVDAGLTLSMRMVQRERWWEPHVRHAYQRWSRRLGSHVPVTIAYGLWTLVSVVLMQRLASSASGLMIVWPGALWFVATALIWCRLQGADGLKGIGRS